MSRSVREPSHFVCQGADPKMGKKTLSRNIRHAVRQSIHADPDGFDFVHPADKNRGRAGSRTPDRGWDFFGDGKVGPWNAAAGLEKAAIAKLSRK